MSKNEIKFEIDKINEVFELKYVYFFIEGTEKITKEEKIEISKFNSSSSKDKIEATNFLTNPLFLEKNCILLQKIQFSISSIKDELSDDEKNIVSFIESFIKSVENYKINKTDI